MNEYLNINTIRQLLNRSVAQLEPKTLAGLSAAREQALLRHAPEKTGRRPMATDPRRRMVTAFATLLVTVSLFGGVAYYWQQTQDNSEADLAILTDDMPVDVYVN
jgi:hypothetical protein